MQRLKIVDKGGKGRIWQLHYSLMRENESYSRIISIKEEDDKKLLAWALVYLQRTLKSLRASELIGVMLLPGEPAPGSSVISTDEMYRLKNRWHGKRLLQIRNPQKVFIKGYGPEVMKKVMS